MTVNARIPKKLRRPLTGCRPSQCASLYCKNSNTLGHVRKWEQLTSLPWKCSAILEVYVNHGMLGDILRYALASLASKPPQMNAPHASPQSKPSNGGRTKPKKRARETEIQSSDCILPETKYDRTIVFMLKPNHCEWHLVHLLRRNVCLIRLTRITVQVFTIH